MRWGGGVGSLALTFSPEDGWLSSRGTQAEQTGNTRRAPAREGEPDHSSSLPSLLRPRAPHAMNLAMNLRWYACTQEESGGAESAPDPESERARASETAQTHRPANVVEEHGRLLLVDAVRLVLEDRVRVPPALDAEPGRARRRRHGRGCRGGAERGLEVEERAARGGSASARCTRQWNMCTVRGEERGREDALARRDLLVARDLLVGGPLTFLRALVKTVSAARASEEAQNREVADAPASPSPRRARA